MNCSPDYIIRPDWLQNMDFFQVGKLYAIGIFCKFKHHNDMMNDPEFTGQMENYLISHNWKEYQSKMEDLVKNDLFPLKSESFWNSATDICIDSGSDSDFLRKFHYFEPFTVLSVDHVSHERCALHIMQTFNGNTEIGNIVLWRDESPKSKFFFNGLFLNIRNTFQAYHYHVPREL